MYLLIKMYSWDLNHDIEKAKSQNSLHTIINRCNNFHVAEKVHLLSRNIEYIAS